MEWKEGQSAALEPRMMMMMMTMIIRLEEPLSLIVSNGQPIQRHQLTVQPHMRLHQYSLNTLKRNHIHLMIYPLHHSIDHLESRSIINQQLAPHLTLLDFIDTTLIPISTHTLLDSVCMADPSITRIPLLGRHLLLYQQSI